MAAELNPHWLENVSVLSLETARTPFPEFKHSLRGCGENPNTKTAEFCSNALINVSSVKS